jgi:hypothetical protein
MRDGKESVGPRPATFSVLQLALTIITSVCGIAPESSHHLAEMDTESEFRIQTGFRKYAEFVALQNQALSLDANPQQASDEESGRRTNLMRSIINIVRRNNRR